MRDDQRGAVDVFDDIRHRERLAAARDAHEHLCADAVQHAFRQFFDRLRLIARRLKGRNQFEICHVTSFLYFNFTNKCSNVIIQ